MRIRSSEIGLRDHPISQFSAWCVSMVGSGAMWAGFSCLFSMVGEPDRKETLPPIQLRQRLAAERFPVLSHTNGREPPVRCAALGLCGCAPVGFPDHGSAPSSETRQDKPDRNASAIYLIADRLLIRSAMELFIHNFNLSRLPRSFIINSDWAKVICQFEF
jgi:hypothetical protein